MEAANGEKAQSSQVFGSFLLSWIPLQIPLMTAFSYLSSAPIVFQHDCLTWEGIIALHPLGKQTRPYLVLSSVFFSSILPLRAGIHISMQQCTVPNYHAQHPLSAVLQQSLVHDARETQTCIMLSDMGAIGKGLGRRARGRISTCGSLM